ncbi:MAG: DNA polymerase/3'-5' exonuclease PolX [Polyangiaceae bacterium]|nr:DNA polymerase/3'-5' exonuclease PolX [Polyangiaceae bacterium]
MGTPAEAPRAALVHNADVAAQLERIADLLEVEDASPFRVRAYRNAARLIGDLPRELGAMIAAGEDLRELPGIGADLAGKIREIVETGASAALREIEARTPPALAALLRVPGLGPKRVRALHEQLGVGSLEELAGAARGGRVRALHGFGEKTEQAILRVVEAHRAEAGRFKLSAVEGAARSLVAFLEAIPGVRRVAVAGSYRRRKETVGDLDVLVTAVPGCDALDRFVARDPGARLVAHGPTRAAVVLRSGLQIDVRLVEEASYGAALAYFTGSKAHNIALRRIGLERGLKINEYGVFRGEERVAGETEASVFASVGLPFIPPELREDRGEIAAAREGRLPRLVALADLRGDLHAHTSATDGRATLREMAEAARARGLRYLAITDHSPRVAVTRGLDPDRLLRQVDEIDRLNAELHGITLLKGVEVDILEDGRLDLPDDVLARLDLVVGAVHGAFRLPRAAQTARVLRAMERPHFSILAHPTGRLIFEREPCDLDMEQVIRRARQRGCFLELNSHPERLDLLDVHAQMARSEGVLVAIDSDAHSALDLANIRFGVGQARRGWLEARDVLNARPLAELRSLLRRTM